MLGRLEVEVLINTIPRTGAGVTLPVIHPSLLGYRDVRGLKSHFQSNIQGQLSVDNIFLITAL